ncbi:DNA polymerase III subunit alpha [Selenomonas ruminantium]|uniref:DNA polymerase-3 subunit alpha n=1 Tax=Selenomonas ruminantium TaxID=971 RepID=A0A1I0YER6_SELRU|nr:DNA polymerase III subunit alpha [Selenomonas ruminantium]SFB10683.1 DNA polymerase-3 subunit alpha [Selenomonas ruminantium]
MYISLHNHTDFSILDGYQTAKEMVNRVKELGQSAVAITDHGTMRGIVEFYRECKAQEIKPIIGCEFYFCPDVTIRDRAFTHHLVLLAMNDTGYRNLKELDSIAYNESHMFYKPRIDENDLRNHAEGLICLSACMASIVNTDNGEEWFQRFKEIFGARFFAEIQPLNIDRQWAYNDKVISLARKYDVPLVVTTDAHYAKAEDEPYHYLWLQIHGNGYHDNENYLHSEDEIIATAWIPDDVKEEAIANTVKIADMCNVEIEFGGMHYPTYTDRDPEEVIREICRENWRSKVPRGKYKEYGKRFEAEMRDLKKANYLNYLLIIWDLVNWCVKNNIPVGEGRGSAAGCLVGYLMGFHKVDSIAYDTAFFRFCNPYRQSPADIDTDVSTDNRGRIIDYIREHYGTVYKVTTYGYTKNPDKPDVGKQAVLRAQQALEKEEYLGLTDEQRTDIDLRKKNKQDTGMRWTRERVLTVTKELTDSMDEILTVNSDFSAEERERLLDVSQHFAGRIDKMGVHASAILVTPDAVEKYCPVEGCTSTDTSTGKREYVRVAAFEYHTLEDMGLLKLDILGLRTLDIIAECLAGIPQELSLEDIPMNDQKTFELYAGGHTTGVFQMESPGMQKVARELHPNRFDDLAVLVALYRPGPIDSGMLQQYVDAKNGKITVEYPCEAMEEIAGSTYGVLVFQEQIMLISMKMAGYDLGQADGLRKVIGRKELPKIKAAVADFVECCMKNGYSREVAEEVAGQIEAAGRYVFNKSHAVSYAKLSYKTAFLKAHYPAQYMCALLNSRSDQKKILPYIEECKRMWIELLPPDLSKGNRKFTVEGDAIRVGLCYIKGVGTNLNLVRSSDWQEVFAANNKLINEGLIKAGALDYLGKDRGWMLANLVSAKEAADRKAHCEERMEFYAAKCLAAETDKERNKANRMVEQWKAKLADVTFKESAAEKYDRIAGEISVLSFSFTSLPKVLTGVAKSVYEFNDKKGNTMAKLVFRTAYGDFDGIVFASAWKKAKYYDRYRGWQKGINVIQGLSYEFIRSPKGIIVDARQVTA